MSDEQTKRILHLEAELVATGKVLGHVVRDLKAWGHDDLAVRVQERCEAAAYDVPLALTTLRDAEEAPKLRDRLKQVEGKLADAETDRDSWQSAHGILARAVKARNEAAAQFREWLQ